MRFNCAPSAYYKVLYNYEQLRHNRGVALRIVSVLVWMERRIRHLRQCIEPAAALPRALGRPRELFDRRDVRARW
jgi:hypothetical protein